MNTTLLARLTSLGVLVVACTPTASGGDSGTCLGDFGPGDCQMATDCLNANCPTELAAVQDPGGPCRDLVGCVAGCSCDMTCTHRCEGHLTTSCQTAYAHATSCMQTRCGDASCPDMDTEDGGRDGSGGSRGSGGTGGRGGSGGGGGSGGTSGDSGGGSWACYQAQGKTCEVAPPGSPTVAQDKAKCESGGAGVVLPTCPLTNLEGCCVIGPFESCFYSGDAASDAMQCAMSSGTWMTTP